MKRQGLMIRHMKATKKVRHLRTPKKPDILMTFQERIQKELEKNRNENINKRRG